MIYGQKSLIVGCAAKRFPHKFTTNRFRCWPLTKDKIDGPAGMICKLGLAKRDLGAESWFANANVNAQNFEFRK